MQENMTVISANMFSKAVEENMSVEKAAQMLRECTQLRTLSDKLGAFAKGRNLRAVLTEGLIENHPESKREAVDRKVRNWLANRQNTISKADAIELCFVLGLDTDEGDALLAMISEEGFHWRSPDEIPYIFALMHNMTYLQARELHEKISAVAPETKNSGSSAEYFTETVRREVEAIGTVEELTEYIISAREKFGNLHNRAYSLFCDMLERLELPEVEQAVTENNPYDEGDSDLKYTMGNIVQIYLHGNDLPKGADSKNNSALSAVQRSIAQNWPSESVISRMKNRHIDVNRKVMILLFLATYDADGYDDGDFYFEDFEEEKTPDEIFREFYQNMNAMLKTCGFSKLDPRSAFDWMSIYCMCREDIFTLDSTLTEFLQTLFLENDLGNDLQN